MMNHSALTADVAKVQIVGYILLLEAVKSPRAGYAHCYNYAASALGLPRHI
jgi:hypothetical protein